MRIFVTGASGWIGSAVVPELIGSGHQVVGLARSDASAAALTAAGAEVQRGTLDDLDILGRAADGSDGVIHLAFKHELAFTGDFAGAATADRSAVETFGEVLAGSDRPFVLASGVLGLLPGQRGDRTGRVGRRHRHDPSACRSRDASGHGAPDDVLRLPRGPLVGPAPGAHRPRRRRQRLHGRHRRHRPGHRHLGVPR